MAVLDWPTGIELFQVGGWSLDTKSTAPGQGLDGRSQVVFRESRFWKGRFQVADIWGHEDAPIFHAFLDQCKGASTVFRLPVYNKWTFTYTGNLRAYYLSLGMTEAQITAGAIYYSDGTSFSDGTGFALPGIEDPVTTASTAAGASSITVTGFIGRNAKVGSLFSYKDFLYRIYSNEDGVLKFNPPLRTAIGTGKTVNINQPYVQVTFATDAEAEAFLTPRWGAPIMLNVKEAFQR